jgi:hypothetical protein
MMEFAYGYITGNKIYRKGFLSVPDKEIGEVRGTDEETISFFRARFHQAELKVQEIENQVATSLNKGSFLVKLIHFRESLYEFAGLGDFELLINKLNSLEEFLKSLILQNRNKNLEIKRAMLIDLDRLKNHHDLKEASLKVKAIRDKWIKTGLVPDELREEMDYAFKECLDYFYNRKKEFADDRRKMISDYVARYRKIIEKAKVLHKDSGTVQSEISALKTEWRQLPKLPYSLINPLWQEFLSALQVEAPHPDQAKTTEADLHLLNIEKEKIVNKLLEISKNFRMGNVELETLKSAWKKLSPLKNKESRILDKTAMDLFNKLSELDFIMKVASRKRENFVNLKMDQQVSLLIRILKDMVERDRKDLEMANNNAGIIHTSDEKIQKMLGRQVENKVKRIATKTDLLNDLSTGKILISISKT